MSSLRTTFTVSFAAVAAGVTVLIGFLSYDAAARLVRVDEKTVFSERVADLRGQVRQQRLDADDFATDDPGREGPRSVIFRSNRMDIQVLGPDGGVVDPGKPRLPVDVTGRRMAGEEQAGRLVEQGEIEVAGDSYRVAIVSLGGGRGAVQVAQEFSDTEDLLRELQQRTVSLVAAVVIGSGLFGWWLARRITRRLVRLTAAAEDVARTRRLGIQVPVTGHDEVARLGRSFDRMLGRLAQSEEDQRRLVQDAGHELRTPLTSLRTNISLLRRIDELPPPAREELVADLAQESRELTDLVNELVDLAAGQSDAEPVQRIALGDIAEDVAVIARRRTGRQVTVTVTGDTTVDGRASALQRAVSNLVDNAVKFDRAGTTPVGITVAGAAHRGATRADTARPPRASAVRVEVLDRGPGVAEEDLPRIFDRFYRTADARSLPGSGLGLSIVREVATSHGGAPFAYRREGGGSVMGFTVAGAPPGDDPPGPYPGPSAG
ncbi:MULTISPECIES: sensor histidine kinase [Streptomyces]|jgi:two-component system sensor histidine kinase MprB|uniref:histidine kinase n=2 Tax=Streptomyces griseoaurantiacus TaxID=68213 RepID=F3NDW3_9ACTN|nr:MULTISPECIES: HAMP domain-containing sensor histidine kinase [Streptomyces]EGG48391.1 two component sensor kinase [Streptomyces griseoaurantiacus M045]MCF0089957.1 Signal transduction histidine-protein kinase/phosphatase MprB [Streptomyces sp. MH192]MDX3089638.1 HAMP domain-containing sensor histidine kinase [Streptomyces sp. ME12-02E]MDX3333068.1 HAMP domain-containing sensor histidine kinase [Streptomyces sp. ME02-6978a]MDX3361793.1 HAMP domain-containing sensor histidine kinase [Streptom